MSFFVIVAFENRLSLTGRPISTLAIKLETTHKPSKPPTKQPNCPQTTHTSHKTARPPTNQPNTGQTTH